MESYVSNCLAHGPFWTLIFCSLCGQTEITMGSVCRTKILGYPDNLTVSCNGITRNKVRYKLEEDELFLPVNQCTQVCYLWSGSESNSDVSFIGDLYPIWNVLGATGLCILKDRLLYRRGRNYFKNLVLWGTSQALLDEVLGEYHFDRNLFCEKLLTRSKMLIDYWDNFLLHFQLVDGCTLMTKYHMCSPLRFPPVRTERVRPPAVGLILMVFGLWSLKQTLVNDYCCFIMHESYDSLRSFG